MAEKNTEELKLRVPPTLWLDLAKLAAAEDRSVSEYCRMVLSLHAYGHAERLAAAACACEGCNGPSQGPQKT
jgi:hypothetical protein